MAMDEVGEDVRYSRTAHPAIIFVQWTRVSHRLDGDYQPDSIASLKEDQAHA